MQYERGTGEAEKLIFKLFTIDCVNMDLSSFPFIFSHIYVGPMVSMDFSREKINSLLPEEWAHYSRHPGKIDCEWLKNELPCP